MFLQVHNKQNKDGCFDFLHVKHKRESSAFQSTRKQYFHCLYVLEAGIKAIHECVFAVYKKAVLLLLVSLQEGIKSIQVSVFCSLQESSTFSMTGYDKNHTELMIAECQVADCARQEFTDQKRSEMTVKEFVEYWQAHHQLSNKAHKEEDFDSSSWKMTQHLLYLKDWHFVKVWVRMEH